MNELLQQIRAIWEGMEPNRRYVLVGVMVVILIALFLLVRFVGQPQYELLYGDLTQVEQDEIIGKLQEMKVPYKKSGASLYTPKSSEVRARLMDAGIPKGGVVGWSIFDKTSLGATNFQNNVSYQRALQDELRRTLRQMQGIIDAQVILTLPENDVVFAEEKIQPTASVMLKVQSPSAISQSKVLAITNLVAASVKGMSPENVTVVDNFLNDLTVGLRNKGWTVNGRPIGDLFSAKLAFEKEMEKNIESMLNRVLGPNKAVARVNADLNMDYQEIKSQTFGDRGVPRSEQERTELFEGSGGVAMGSPGTDSNLTEYLTSTGQNGNNRLEKTDRTVNYEINKTEEFRVKAPGEVRRLTVSLFVDGELSPAQKQQMELSVANAVGLDERRGDRLTVANLPFNREDPFKDLANDKKVTWDQMVRLGALLVGLVLMIVFFFMLLRSALKPSQTKVAPVKGAQVDGVVGDIDDELAITKELTPEEQNRVDRQLKLEKFAREHPEDVAVLLKAWLSED